MIWGTGNFVVREARNAFTLVEVMLAVSILAIGLIGVLGAYTALIDGLEAAQQNIKAVCLLKGKKAEIKEKALKELNIPAGTDRGRFGTGSRIFEWVSVVKVLSPSDLGIIAPFEAEEEKPRNYLSQLEVRVFNEKAKPSRGVTVWSYLDGYQRE